MKANIYYVCPAPRGGWSVFGSGIEPPLSTFAARGAAVEFACEVAESAVPGEVRILGFGGTVEELWVCASAARGVSDRRTPHALMQ
ncbi:MAG: DUF2188 domain-containing protein [Betaproteobacteria bacterium]